MTKLAHFASDFRVRALICSSVTVLLAACGGTESATPASAPQANTASYSATSAAVQSAEVTSADTAVAAADAAVAPAAEGAPANFDFVGYAVDPRTPEAGGVAAEQAAPAQDPSAPRMLAGTVSYGAVIPTTANNFYVATTGSDSNPGTKAAPFKTLARAARATKPNTTVFVAPGTYFGGLKTTISGSSTGRIYFVSTTKHGAKIVPPASSSTKYAWDNRGNYVTIAGFEVDGTKTQSGTKWLLGIYNGGSYDVISENRVHHIGKTVTCGSGGGSAINTDKYYGGVKSDVIGNLVHDIGPTGCRYIQGIYISTSGNVKNNVVYRVAEAAIHLWHDATNVIITNNTVTTSHTGIIVGGGDFYTGSINNNTAVYNNIVIDNVYGISEQGKTGTSNTYRNNLVMRNSGYNYRLLNGLKYTNNVGSDPLFVSYSKTMTTPNYHLTSSSPAIGRGTSTFAHATDYDGRPRNATTGYDIGAFQH